MSKTELLPGGKAPITTLNKYARIEIEIRDFNKTI